mgnify:CR=1 FL=1
MRVPVPNNRLVAFTLAGALLTALVAGALAVPLGPASEQETTTANANGSSQLAADAPTPNQDFTPTVQTQSGYSEHEEAEEDEHEEDDEHDEALEEE